MRDTSARAEVEVVLGELGPEIEQLFWDQLEFWDVEESELIEELESPERLDDEGIANVVRLCYRIEWDESEGEARHWVDFPKSSDAGAGVFRRLTRTEREALPFVGSTATGRVLSLAPRSSFRELVDQAEGDGLADALDDLVQRLQDLGSDLASVDQVANALEAVVAPWRVGLGISDTPAEDIVRFLPEGGAVAAILRSLAPALDLPNAPESLPLVRHGSTVHALASHGQLIARATKAGVVALDDFGDRLDSASAHHSADLLRRASGQLWLATRVPQVAEAFAPEEIVRLSWTGAGERARHYGHRPTTKGERLAARHMSIQIFPAMSAASVVIVEGPHDRAALNALIEKLGAEEAAPGFAAYRIALIDAGAADASGGTGSVVRLADAAVNLGFRTVVVLDHDRADQATTELASAIAAADAVIRLPEGFAIERALCDGLDDEAVRESLRALTEGFVVQLPDGLDDLEGRELRRTVVRMLKGSGGLHAEFVAALDEGAVPPVARAVIEAAIAACTGGQSGHIQL